MHPYKMHKCGVWSHDLFKASFSNVTSVFFADVGIFLIMSAVLQKNRYLAYTMKCFGEVEDSKYPMLHYFSKLRFYICLCQRVCASDYISEYKKYRHYLSLQLGSISSVLRSHLCGVYILCTKITFVWGLYLVY